MTMTRFEVYEGDRVTTLLPKATATKLLCFVERDWECSRWGGRVRDMGFTTDGEERHAVPMVFRLGDIEYNDGHYTYLGKDWQLFTFNLLSLSYYGKTWNMLSDVEYDWLAKRWASVYGGKTAFTNRQGPEKNRNWVTRERGEMNEDAKQGIGLYSMVCGGASISGTVITNSKGSRMLKVDAFDGTKPPPDISTINFRTDPRIFFATIISDHRVSGGYKTFRFAQLANSFTGEVKDVPVPIVVSKPSYYPMEDLRVVTNGVKPNPYWP